MIKDDVVNEYRQRANDADGMIMASPVYDVSVAGTMKSFFDRLFYVATANNGLFRHKVGASLIVSRRTGGLTTFKELNQYLLS